MHTRTWVLVIALMAAASASLRSPTTLPPPPAREPEWAFPVQNGSLPAEPLEPVSVEGWGSRVGGSRIQREPVS